MDLLKEKILCEGRVIGTEVLKVDSFLNHRIDPQFMQAIGKEFARRFAGCGVTKIVTIESSGIAPAVFAGLFLDVPVVCAKKTESRNLDADTYQAPVLSFTRGKESIVRINKRFIDSSDHILFIDDFLAHGQALQGLISIVKEAGATVVGAGIVIEKGFQAGGKAIRDLGVRVDSLAIIKSMSEKDGTIIFEEEV